MATLYYEEEIGYTKGTSNSMITHNVKTMFINCLPKGRHSGRAHEFQGCSSQKCSRGGVGWGGGGVGGGGVGHVGVGWGGSCRGGVGHVGDGVGWVM